MEAKDLRIGNAVAYNQTIYKVDSICNSENYVFLILLDEGVCIKASLNLISPVPLVVEILRLFCLVFVQYYIKGEIFEFFYQN